MTVNSVCFPAQARGQASSIHPLLTVPLLSPCGSINGVRLHLPGQHKCLFTKLLIRVWLAAVRPHLRPLAAGLCSAWMRGVVPALLRSLHVLAIRAHFKDEPNARDHSCPCVLSGPPFTSCFTSCSVYFVSLFHIQWILLYSLS